MLLTLLRGTSSTQTPTTFEQVGGPLLGLFPFITMFLVTSITMLRERTTGTLERLMTMPLAKLDLLFGYGDRVRAARGRPGARRRGRRVRAARARRRRLGRWLVVALAVGNAVLGMALGLFVSAFARTEFQAVQFMPAIVLPQLLLCGLFVARDADGRRAAGRLRHVPLTYAFEALARASPRRARSGSRGVLDVVGDRRRDGLLLALGAATLRRRTP